MCYCNLYHNIYSISSYNVSSLRYHGASEDDRFCWSGKRGRDSLPWLPMAEEGKSWGKFASGLQNICGI